VSRVMAGALLIAIISVWLVAWLPMALYCFLALAGARFSLRGRPLLQAPI
jgi:hypothetical protein